MTVEHYICLYSVAIVACCIQEALVNVYFYIFFFTLSHVVYFNFN